MYSVPASESGKHAHGWGRVLYVMSVLIGGLLTVGSAAAEAPKRLVVLHGADDIVEGALRVDVDALVLRTLSERAGFSSVYASPIPFEDVELAAGCSSRDADCLQRIAATLGADWVLVREFARDRSGNQYLTLIAHDGPRALVTRRAVAEISTHPQSAPTRVVPLLLERLYPTQQPAVTATPTAQPTPSAQTTPASEPRGTPAPIDTAPRDGVSPAAIIGWSMVGVGLTLSASSIALFSLSRRDQRAYADTEIRTTDDVDRALALDERAEKRSRYARGLAIGGVSAAALGVATLVWHRLRSRRVESVPVAVTLLPSRGGLALALSGAWRGGP